MRVEILCVQIHAVKKSERVYCEVDKRFDVDKSIFPACETVHQCSQHAIAIALAGGPTLG